MFCSSARHGAGASALPALQYDEHNAIRNSSFSKSSSFECPYCDPLRMVRWFTARIVRARVLSLPLDRRSRLAFNASWPWERINRNDNVEFQCGRNTDSSTVVMEDDESSNCSLDSVISDRGRERMLSFLEKSLS